MFSRIAFLSRLEFFVYSGSGGGAAVVCSRFRPPSMAGQSSSGGLVLEAVLALLVTSASMALCHRPRSGTVLCRSCTDEPHPLPPCCRVETVLFVGVFFLLGNVGRITLIGFLVKDHQSDRHSSF